MGERISPAFDLRDVEIRRHYMAMYRVYTEKEPFYPAEVCDAEVIAGMLAEGHVEVCGAGYRLTYAGRVKWAQMCAYMQGSGLSTAKHAELMQMVAEEQAWRKYLTPGQERSLRDLREHPRAPGHFHKQTLAYLLERGWVAWDMQMIAITERGQYALDRFDSRQRRTIRTRKQHRPRF